MILLSRFLDKKWIEPNAKKFFLKSVGPPTVEYTHLQLASTSFANPPMYPTSTGTQGRTEGRVGWGGCF